jgi:hypothetical protein
MLPGSQLFAFTGAARPAAAAGFDTAALTADAASAIDRDMRGVPRRVDHEWWLAHPGLTARSLNKRGKLAGYYYVHQGRIGAAAWLDPTDGPPLLAHAMHDAAKAAEEVKIVIPGMNHTALDTVLRAGLRLERSSHLLWTEPIGRMEHYIPSGPLLF